MDYFKRISIEQELQKAHVNNYLTKEDSGGGESIDKGIADELGYADKNAAIKKSGKEIKEKLKGHSTELESSKIMLMGEMESLAKQIGIMPMCPMDGWRVKDYGKVINKVPNKYSYDQMYPQEKGQPEMIASNEQTVVVTPEQKEKWDSLTGQRTSMLISALTLLKLALL